MGYTPETSQPAEQHSTSDRELLLKIDARLARMERLHEELLVKRPKQKDIAKQMGVHPTTLSRRRQRERLRRLAGGGSI